MLDMYAFHIKKQKLILSVSLLVTMRILNHTRLRSMWWLGNLLVQVTRQDTRILIMYTSYCHSFTWSFYIKKRKKKIPTGTCLRSLAYSEGFVILISLSVDEGIFRRKRGGCLWPPLWCGSFGAAWCASFGASFGARLGASLGASPWACSRSFAWHGGTTVLCGSCLLCHLLWVLSWKTHARGAERQKFAASLSCH